MISHAKLAHHGRMFKTLTGLSTEGFKQILPSFEEAWEADLDRLIIERRTRKIKGLSTTCEGKKHDKKLADEQALRFPKGSKDPIGNRTTCATLGRHDQHRKPQ